MKVWKPIPGTKDYMISSNGEVRNGRGLPVRTYPSINGRGKSVSLYLSNGKLTTKSLAAIVLEVFVGPRPMGAVPRYKNKDARDLSAKNLEWRPRKKPAPEPNIELAEEIWDEVKNSHMLQDAQRPEEYIPAFKKLAALYHTNIETISLIYFGKLRGWLSWYRILLNHYPELF